MTITIADGRGALWQWDTGRRLRVGSGVEQIHYQNRALGSSVDVDVGTDGTAIIPDELLQDCHTLTAYAYVTDDTGAYTMVQQDFAVHKRAKPAGYVYAPTDQMTLQTIQRQIGDLADLTTEAKDTLVGAEFLKNNIWKHNEGAVYGSNEYGYCYRDFAEKKLRVICLNSCEGETISGNDAAYCFSPAQLLWFAQTLYDVGSKADAAQWGVIVLAHYPLDLGGAYPAGNIVKAYVAGESTTQNGVTVNFSGHNAAKFIMNVHGHVHCYQYGKLHSVANGKGTEFDAWRMCTPNACFYRNNSGVVTMYGISFGDPAPYDKTAGSGKDTAFNVNVINPSEQVVYSFCYGAGIDRTIGYAATVYHSITNTLTHVTTSNDTVAAEDGTAYSATITAANGYTMSSVTITMGGMDITATVYNANTGVISISKVTGDVVVTAKATKIVSYHNLVPKAVDTSGGICAVYEWQNA